MSSRVRHDVYQVRGGSIAVASVAARLSALSTRAHHPLVEFDWESEVAKLTPSDPRWVSAVQDPLLLSGGLALHSVDDRARFALAKVCHHAQLVVDFEALLQIGLLSYARTLEPGSPEQRYLYHEVIEEAEHSQMFLELIRRTMHEWPDLPVTSFADSFFQSHSAHIKYLPARPELIFVGALIGEETIDLIQRAYLQMDPELQHPLAAAVCRRHVKEEARHLAFARAWLAERVRALPPKRRRQLQLELPNMVRSWVGVFVDTPDFILDAFGFDASVRERPAYRRGRDEMFGVMTARLREYLTRIELIVPSTEEMWRRMVPVG